jgi:hypothetical protein
MPATANRPLVVCGRNGQAKRLTAICGKTVEAGRLSWVDVAAARINDRIEYERRAAERA